MWRKGFEVGVDWQVFHQMCPAGVRLSCRQRETEAEAEAETETETETETEIKIETKAETETETETDTDTDTVRSHFGSSHWAWEPAAGRRHGA